MSITPEFSVKFNDAPLSVKEAFAILLSNITASALESMRAGDFARALVWCEVGLTVATQKKVPEAEQAKEKPELRTYKRRPTMTLVVNEEVRCTMPGERLGQVGRIILGNPVDSVMALVRFDDATAWVEPKYLERGRTVSTWVPET